MLGASLVKLLLACPGCEICGSAYALFLSCALLAVCNEKALPEFLAATDTSH